MRVAPDKFLRNDRFPEFKGTLLEKMLAAFSRLACAW